MTCVIVYHNVRTLLRRDVAGACPRGESVEVFAMLSCASEETTYIFASGCFAHCSNLDCCVATAREAPLCAQGTASAVSLCKFFLRVF